MPAYLTPGVYVEEVTSGPRPIEGIGTAVGAFVGFASQGPVGTPVLVTNWGQFISTFGDAVSGGYLAQSVYGYFLNGGTRAYITRIESARQSQQRVALPSRLHEALPTLELSATGATAASGEISVEVRVAGEEAPEGSFTVVVRQGATEETFSDVTLSRRRGARNVVDIINEESKIVRAAERASSGTLAERAPMPGTFTLSPPSAAALAPLGQLPLQVRSSDFGGDITQRSGIEGLAIAEDVTMVACPDLMAAYQAGSLDRDGVKAVQLSMIAHAEMMGDRMAILDPLPDLTPAEVRDWRLRETNYDSKYAAMYYPWITVPGWDGRPQAVPPSGHIAGIWARSDAEGGIHKAPANEVIRGALALAGSVTKGEQDVLNPIGVNCIRAFPGRGIRVWGARTLTSDPAWRYVNVRRLFSFVEKSIELGTQWVVFEPNNRDLWERVKRDVGAFLHGLWDDGALVGATPAEAYFVKCDEELNPPDVRDLGRLHVEIGIAPVRPAEFVVFRISQVSPGGAS